MDYIYNELHKTKKINSFHYDDIKLKYNYAMYENCVMSD